MFLTVINIGELTVRKEISHPGGRHTGHPIQGCCSCVAWWAFSNDVPGVTPTELPPFVTTGNTSSLCLGRPGQPRCWPNLVLCDLAISLPARVFLLHLPRLDGTPWVTTGHIFSVVIRGNRETARRHDHEKWGKGLRALVKHCP